MNIFIYHSITLCYKISTIFHLTTNHLGLRKTGTRSNRIAKNAANFQGGNNQSFKQGRGDQSLHGKVQQSTGIKKGTVRNAQRENSKCNIKRSRLMC